MQRKMKGLASNRFKKVKNKMIYKKNVIRKKINDKKLKKEILNYKFF